MKLYRRSFCCVTKLVALMIVLATLTMLCVGCKADKMKQAEKNGNDYTIVMSYDPDTHSLSANQTTEFTNKSNNAFTELFFHIYANAYREEAQPVVPSNYRSAAYPDGVSYGDIAVDYVKVNDKACAFKVCGDNADLLSVPLEKELYPDEKVVVEFNYKVTLANIKHRLGYTSNTVSCANFFPILCNVSDDDFCKTSYCAVGDPFVSPCANFDVTVTAPSKFVVAASGNLAEVTSEDGYDTWHFSGKAIRDFTVVMSDKYKKLSVDVEETRLNYYYFADEDADKSLAVAEGMFKYLSEHVGKYPYPQYNLCETEFCYGGMEYPSLSTVSSGQSAYITAVAHETAHQWFYAVVGNDQIANPWMDEGLCEFLTYKYLDNADITPLETSIKATTKNYVTYVDVLNRYYDHVDTSFRAIDKYKNDGEYVVMTYVKGCLLFDTLCRTMGEKKFFAALADYYDECAFDIATPSQMVSCFVKRGGKELRTIFDKYAEGKDIIGKVTDR